MNVTSLSRTNRLTFLIISTALWLAVSIRWLMEFVEQNHPLIIPLAVMMLAYGILLIVEFVLRGSNPLRTHFYLVFQTSLVFIAMLFFHELDFFALLYIPLSGQAAFRLPHMSARAWVGILILTTLIGQFIQFGWPEFLSFAILYVAAIVFVALFSENTLQSEQARRRSDALLGELQEAHRQLQDLADQAQELAVAQERNRLARELHDSVAQTLYGLTLRSEAALRKLGQGDTEGVAAYLQEFQESTQQSLKETRLLIYELRPEILSREGLRAALIARLEFVEKRSGLNVQMDLDEIGAASLDVHAALYGIAREALNNTLKHAQASSVQITLKQTEKRVRMGIEDDGVGFNADRISESGGLGLEGMKERAAQIGAELEVFSTPGEGVRVTVEVPV